MIIITNVYSPNRETEVMHESFTRQGYEVATTKAKGNGLVLKELLACYKRAATGHELFMYSDAADTFCQRKLTKKEEVYLSDKIVYSAEKNCYPDKSIAAQYSECKTDFKYLNGGNYAGPLALIIEFFERYKLNTYHANVNGQYEQSIAYLQAVKDGFPIELDTNCKIFQTTAFDPINEGHPDASYFAFTPKGLVKNTNTKTTPAVLHANGRSPLNWIWDKHEWTKK